MTDAVSMCKELNSIEELKAARVDALYKAAIVADQVGYLCQFFPSTENLPTGSTLCWNRAAIMACH